MELESINILFGGHDLENVNENELELRSVVERVTHPKFEAKTFNNDIAVLKFDDPVPFSRSIGPVCLPQSGEFYKQCRNKNNEKNSLYLIWILDWMTPFDWIPIADIDYAGRIAVVTGWGRVNETGNISPILRQVDVPVYTNADCHKTKYGIQAITDNMMCAGYEKGELDACQGDSGGPLHLEGKDRKIDLIGNLDK